MTDMIRTAEGWRPMLSAYSGPSCALDDGGPLWGPSRINECAEKLGAMDLPPEAVAVLRDLFAELASRERAD